MKAVILAAGQGKRLFDYTKGEPKCLLQFGNESILSRQIRLLQEVGLLSKDIFVVGGYQHEKLKKMAPNLIVNPLYAVKENAYSLGVALQQANDDDVLILDGDLCFEADLLKEIIEEQNSNVLMCKDSVDLNESTGIIVENGRVRAIGKQYKNTGLVYISIFKVAKVNIPVFRKALFQFANTWYTLAITKICDSVFFVPKVTKQKWHEVDFPEDYKESLQMFGLEEIQR